MGHLRAQRVAVDGKLRASNADRPTKPLAVVTRRSIIAAATLFVAALSGTAGHADTGPFAGMAGNWSGGGTVTLDDGSSERLRCRASYAVGAGGNGLNLNLICASDSYKFDLKGNVIAERGVLSGTWSESGRGVSGTLEGRGANGDFKVVASTAGFTSNITLTTRENKQSVVIKADNIFRSVNMALTRR